MNRFGGRDAERSRFSGGAKHHARIASALKNGNRLPLIPGYFRNNWEPRTGNRELLLTL